VCCSQNSSGSGGCAAETLASMQASPAQEQIEKNSSGFGGCAAETLTFCRLCLHNNSKSNKITKINVKDKVRSEAKIKNSKIFNQKLKKKYKKVIEKL
jgi:hypothetical protein